MKDSIRQQVCAKDESTPFTISSSDTTQDLHKDLIDPIGAANTKAPTRTSPNKE